MLLDGFTGRPRISVDIKEAADLSVIEEDARGLRTVKWRPFMGAGSPKTGANAPEGVYHADNDGAAPWASAPIWRAG